MLLRHGQLLQESKNASVSGMPERSGWHGRRHKSAHRIRDTNGRGCSVCHCRKPARFVMPPGHPLLIVETTEGAASLPAGPASWGRWMFGALITSCLRQSQGQAFADAREHSRLNPSILGYISPALLYSLLSSVFVQREHA